MLSNSKNLPDDRIRLSSTVQASLRNRKGWLHTFRSCMSTLFKPLLMGGAATSPLRGESFFWTPVCRICS